VDRSCCEEKQHETNTEHSPDIITTVQSDHNLAGTRALLPDDQLVEIEIVHDDGYATVRRLEGQWQGMIAVCELSKLRPLENPSPADSSARASEPPPETS